MEFGPGEVFASISIHALLAESDQGCGYYYLWVLAFLSTLSLRRATYVRRMARQAMYISIHALLAESDLFRQNFECFRWIISIHALLAESDIKSIINRLMVRHFYPRSPCGERQPK